MNKPKSVCYRDYVIKKGRFIGKFEEMYQHSSEIPWHQDLTAMEISVEIDIAIIKFFQEKLCFSNVCEIGSGLGYVTNRLQEMLKNVKLTGFDISETAVGEARKKFPHIKFETLDVLNLSPEDIKSISTQYDLVIIKELCWYVLHELERFWENICSVTQKYLYISQCFPEEKEFYGSKTLPKASVLCEMVREQKFRILYSCVERDNRYGDRELIHILAEKQNIA